MTATAVLLMWVMAPAASARTGTSAVHRSAARHTVPTAPPGPPPPPPPPKAWVLVDVDTGNVIDAGDDHEPLLPASLTKVITALAATSQLPADATVPVSDRAAAAPAHKLEMKAGEVWPLKDALNALLMSSANDAAIALAERAGGSVEQFQQIFATTATALDMHDDPVLRDPAGLDDTESVGGGNLVSARDLAIAGRALLASPLLGPIVGQQIYKFTGPDGVGHRLVNHNHLLWSYPGAIGMKTGWTTKAGGCLIAAATRDGRTMLSVVLHASDIYGSSTALLDKGFATAVSDESPVDRLPPVPADLGTKLRSTPTTQPPGGVGAGESAAGPLLRTGHRTSPIATIDAAVSSPPAIALESGVGLVALLRVRAGRRRRRSGRHRQRRRTEAGPLSPR